MVSYLMMLSGHGAQSDRVTRWCGGASGGGGRLLGTEHRTLMSAARGARPPQQ